MTYRREFCNLIRTMYTGEDDWFLSWHGVVIQGSKHVLHMFETRDGQIRFHFFSYQFKSVAEGIEHFMPDVPKKSVESKQVFNYRIGVPDGT